MWFRGDARIQENTSGFRLSAGGPLTPAGRQAQKDEGSGEAGQDHTTRRMTSAARWGLSELETQRREQAGTVCSSGGRGCRQGGAGQLLQRPFLSLPLPSQGRP